MRIEVGNTIFTASTNKLGVGKYRAIVSKLTRRGEFVVSGVVIYTSNHETRSKAKTAAKRACKSLAENYAYLN